MGAPSDLPIQDIFNMAEVQEAPQAPHERKPRRSVAFSGDDTIMDENGEISEAPTNTAEDNPTAEKHSSPPESSDKTVDEMTDMFAGLNKKKKKPSSKPKIADGETPADSEAAPVDDAFDPTALKKKKKKSTKKTEAAGDDFAAKLASAGLEPGADGPVETSADQPQEQTGDMSAGTGIWAHEATTPISYDLLLKRFFQLVRRYIVEYVTCKTCRSPNTELSKGENRLYFVTCNSCGSRRSVTAIKSGFTAQVGKRKRMQG